MNDGEWRDTMRSLRSMIKCDECVWYGIAPIRIIELSLEFPNGIFNRANGALNHAISFRIPYRNVPMHDPQSFY